MDTHTILLQVGFPSLHFGAAPEEVREKLGEPDSVETFDGSGFRWEFFELGVGASFCVIGPDKHQLVELHCTHSECEVNGIRLEDVQLSRLLPLLAQHGISLHGTWGWGGGGHVASFSKGLTLICDKEIVTEASWAR